MPYKIITIHVEKPRNDNGYTAPSYFVHEKIVNVFWNNKNWPAYSSIVLTIANIVLTNTDRSRVKKRVSERVSSGVMHIIRSETLGETRFLERSLERVSSGVMHIIRSENLGETRFWNEVPYMRVAQGPIPQKVKRSDLTAAPRLLSQWNNVRRLRRNYSAAVPICFFRVRFWSVWVDF